MSYSMSKQYPVVLFIEDNDEAYNSIGLHIEPVFSSMRVAKARFAKRYLTDPRPDVVVISDNVSDQFRDAGEILQGIRSEYAGPILILTECISPLERTAWLERGATETILHPTRLKPRLKEMTREILGIAAMRHRKKVKR